MQGGELDTRFEMAVRIRAGEKEVLQQIIATSGHRIQRLSDLEYYQDRRLRNLGLVGEQGEAYCQPM